MATWTTDLGAREREREREREGMGGGNGNSNKTKKVPSQKKKNEQGTPPKARIPNVEETH